MTYLQKIIFRQC